MPKIKDIDLHKHTLNLREGDYAKMQELFPALGGGAAIRKLISNFVDKHFGADPDKP
jgi:hypothetical protein